MRTVTISQKINETSRKPGKKEKSKEENTEVPRDIIIQNQEKENRKHIGNVQNETLMGHRMYFVQYEYCPIKFDYCQLKLTYVFEK